MLRLWSPPARWILVVAAALSLFSTAQAYRLTMLNLRVPEGISILSLLLLNTVYWFIPAFLTIPIFYLSRRHRLDSPRWPRALAVHVGAALLYSVLHTATMLMVRGLLWPDAGKAYGVAWTSFVQRQYLMQLDWMLMTYTAIVGLSYALDYRRESQDRAVKAGVSLAR